MQIIEVTQGTPEWLAARSGTITGTRLQKVVSAKKETRDGLILELIAEKLAPIKESYTSSAMERGHLIESLLKEDFPEYSEVGMIKRDGCDWIGISPDAVKIDEDGKIRKALEVKGLEAKGHIEVAIKKEIPSEYVWQGVHYFIVIDELEELEFMFFNPEIFDPTLRLVRIKMTRESVAAKIEEAQAKIVSFRAEWKDAMKVLVPK
jgi:hypothetical protein